MAAVTSAVFEAFGQNRLLKRANISVWPDAPKNLLYHVSRSQKVFAAIAMMIAARAKGGRSCYCACNAGFGLIYNIVLAALARLLGMGMTLHHHSFAYVDRRSPLMALLVRVGGGGLRHVFLCPRMHERFQARYRPIDGLVLSNAVFVDIPADRRAERRDGPLRIGLLSNLTREKGLHDFLELVAAARAEGLAEGVLAGPAEGADLAAIEAAELDYRGPVAGDAKARFFADIDVFVFPTRYVNEAQPLVVFEAMAAGAPVLAYDRGCISGQIGDILPPLDREAAFTPWALEQLRSFSTDRDRLTRLGAASAARFQAEAEEARRVLTAMAETA